MIPTVLAVSKNSRHEFSKLPCESIQLLVGLGIQGDAHMGETVKHRSRVRVDPTQPNLRQVHLLHDELIEALRDQGFSVEHGSMGENITTRGLDLLALPRHTLLRIGQSGVIEITGLRNPCHQIDDYQDGLLDAVLERRSNGELIRKAGVMGIVIAGGEIRPDDQIQVELPSLPHENLGRV
jgi:MOSC domain-containing protein YiiM